MLQDEFGTVYNLQSTTYNYPRSPTFAGMLKNLIPLNLPEPDLRLAKKDGAVVVWDDIRKKYLQLTPEEWVRQHFVHYLINLGYPKTTVSLEGGFHLNQKLQRTDILIYKNGKPTLLVECKAPQVAISQNTFDQAARYNLHYKTPYILITNGLQHYSAKVDYENKAYNFLENIPAYHEI